MAEELALKIPGLLEGTGWLPEPLRLPVSEAAEQEAPDTDLPDFLNEEDGEFCCAKAMRCSIWRMDYNYAGRG